jgi:eukaryotic-like serine/threonine-protein kinase
MTSFVPLRENGGSALPRSIDPRPLPERRDRGRYGVAGYGAAVDEEASAEIPGHDVQEMIGAGGMGAVHRARQESLRRDVAVKILSRTSPEDCDRFLREAMVLAQLDHPNIVPIYDYGIDADGRCFYSMKMVRGRTLKAILTAAREGVEAWTLERLLEVFRKTCDAVAFAHARGVIHRDLKPDNIMVGEFGEVLVMDWGLAGEIKGIEAFAPRAPNGVPQVKRKGAIDSDVELTMEGEVLGTPQYMSPEQANACCDLDERCDVYALGGILHTILTLRPPVPKGDINDMLESVRMGKIEPFHEQPEIEPSRTTPWRIPAGLVAVVRKAMALEREDRFVGAVALAADVDAYLAGYATSAEHLHIAGQLWLLIKRHRTVSIAVLVLLVVSAGFFVELVDSEKRARSSAEAARRNEGVARGAERVAKSNEAAAREALAKARIALADSAYAANDSEQMRAALAVVPEDLRDTNWRYLNARKDDRQALPAWQDDGFLIGSVAHPGLPGIFTAATSADEHRIIDFDAKTGKVHREFAHRGGWVRAIAYSPDGKLIALGRIMDEGVSIHDAEDGREIGFWKSGWADSMEFLPDGRRLLQSDQSGCVMWDATNGAEIWRSKHGMTHLLVPGGKEIASVSAVTLRVLSAEDGSVLATYPIKEVTPITASLSPDGAEVVMAHVNGQISCFRLADGSLVFETPAGDNGAIMRSGFTADGRYLITLAVIRDSVQTVQIRDPGTGRVLRYLRGGGGGPESMSIHPLSADLLITGSRSATWVLPHTREPRWKLRPGKIAGGFLGSDDVFLAPSSSEPLGAIDLRDGTEKWKPSRQATLYSATSADGLTGVMQVTTQERSKRDFTVVRADGDALRECASVRYVTDGGSLALNADGSRVAMSGAWGGVAAYRTVTGEILPAMDNKDIAFTFGLAWHGTDTKRLIGIFNRFARRGKADAEDWIVAWDTETGERVAAERSPTPLHCLATEPGGLRLAEAGDDKVVRIRDASTLALLSEFRAHDGPINAIAWNPKRPMIATGSTDRSVRIWDAETGRLIEELHIGMREPEALYFSPSGKRLACVIPGEKTLVWEVQ